MKGEFGRDEDGGGGRGQDRAGAVEGGSQHPARGAVTVPVPYQPGLADGESDEHPDRVERDQPVGAGVDRDQQDGREHGQGNDAITVHRPFGPQAQQVGQPVVVGQQAHQHWQAAEAGVGGQRQDQGDGNAGRVIGPAGAERAGDELGQHGDATTGRDVLAADQDRQPDQHRAEQRAEHQLGPLSASGARFPEGGDSVGDGFDPGQRRATGGEGLQDQNHADRLADADRLRAADHRRRV